MLFRCGRRQLEIWFCPYGVHIEPHSHPHIDSTIRMLWGDMDGTIGERRGWVQWWKPYLIPAGTVHSAKLWAFTIFTNWERWTGEEPITSAVEDFTAL